MPKLFANNGVPDQTPHSAASDLGLHCLPITLLRVSRLQWVNLKLCMLFSKNSHHGSSSMFREWVHLQGRQFCQNCLCLPSEKGPTLKEENLLLHGLNG